MSLKCLYAQRFRKNNSTYVFFFLIALTDLAVLYTGALRLLVLAFTGKIQAHLRDAVVKIAHRTCCFRLGLDVRTTSLFICRAHRFTTYFLLQFSSALLTLMTLDRARKTLSMLPPLKKTTIHLRQPQTVTNNPHNTFRTRARQSKLLWITCLVVAVLLILDSHFFYCTGYRQDQNKGQIICQSVGEHRHCRRYWMAYLWLDAFIYSYVPFLIITICNLRLIVYLQQQRKRRLALTSSLVHPSQNHRITCSVIVMSALFLLLAVPVSFLEQFEYTLKHYKYFYHWLAVAYLAMYFNHAISFFLFLFGTQFRESVKEQIWAQATEPTRTDTTLFALVQK